MHSYQTDTFIEQMVTKKTTLQDTLKRIAVVVAALVLMVLFWLVLPTSPGVVGSIFATVGVFLGLGSAYGAYFLLLSMQIEYEYILTDGELDIDKIMGKKRRKRMLSFAVANITEIGPYRSPVVSTSGFSVLPFCEDENFKNTYYAKLEHKTSGRTLLLFSPDERMCKELRRRTKATIWKG